MEYEERLEYEKRRFGGMELVIVCFHPRDRDARSTKPSHALFIFDAGPAAQLWPPVVIHEEPRIPPVGEGHEGEFHFDGCGGVVGL
jgi:hypothetical protein